MAAGFEHFKSTDVGAPVLTAQVGSMIALLDWILVTKGGWAKPFTGTNLAAYRSDTGNRFFLRVDDTQATFSRMRAYRNMTAIGSGTNSFPATTQFGGGGVNSWGWMKGYSAGADARRYWGVRTNRYFIIVIESVLPTELGSYYRHVYAFGDFPSYINADAHNTLLRGIPDANASFNAGIATYYATDRMAANSTGYASSASSTVLSGTPDGSVTSPLAEIVMPSKGFTSTYNAAVKLGNTFFFNGTGIISTNSATLNNGSLPRGKLPNLSLSYGGGSSVSDVNYPVYDLNPITVGSRTFLPLLEITDGSTSVGECILLETTDTDGAL